jgi:hypothetical protein
MQPAPPVEFVKHAAPFLQGLTGLHGLALMIVVLVEQLAPSNPKLHSQTAVRTEVLMQVPLTHGVLKHGSGITVPQSVPS